MTAAQVLSVPETHQQTRAQHHLPERLTCSSQRCGTSSAQDSAGPVPGRMDRQGARTPAVRFPRTGPPPAPAHPGRTRSRPHAGLREPEAPQSRQQGPQALDTALPAAAQASPTRRTLPSWPGPPQQEAGEAPGSCTGSVPGGEGCCPHGALTAGGGGCSWAGLAPSLPSRGGRLTEPPSLEEGRNMSTQHLQSLLEGPPAPWHGGPVWKRGHGGELGQAFRDSTCEGPPPKETRHPCSLGGHLCPHRMPSLRREQAVTCWHPTHTPAWVPLCGVAPVLGGWLGPRPCPVLDMRCSVRTRQGEHA